ncbi:MAG TPA: hypothetical protein VHF22_01380, partial [Planctomycetota bacterium]|nr:hypothetical protein [Planctomycetota bacterium]
MRRSLRLVLLLVLALAPTCASAAGVEESAAPAQAAATAPAAPAPATRTASDEAPVLADSAVGLWPLVSVERADDGTRKASVLWPLFRYESGPAGRRSSFVPLWWHSSDATARSTVAFPLVWSFADRTADTSTLVVAPLLGYRRVKDRSAGAVFPLYWWGSGGGESAHVAFPLVWRFSSEAARSSTTVVAPLWFDFRSGDETTRLAAPLVYWHDAPGGVADRVVFPFYWSFEAPGRSSRTLWPLGGFADDEGATSGNALSYLVRWRRSKADPGTRGVDVGAPGILGFFSRSTSPGASATQVLHVGPPEAGVSLVGAWRSPAGSGFHAFPLVFQGRSGDERHLAVLPLFAGGGDARRAWGMALPPLVRWEGPADPAAPPDEPRSQAAGVPGIFDLYRHESGAHGDETRAASILPFVGGGLPLAAWRRTPEERRFHAFPLVYGCERERDGSGYAHVFPFYSDIHRGDGGRIQAFLGPVYVRSRGPSGARDDVLWPL